MVAGGGASVIYADTICDLGHAGELANYGEYSGDPNTEETYLYCKTILDLMTREKDPRGKVLMIGGAIANFTDVANTFTGYQNGINIVALAAVNRVTITGNVILGNSAGVGIQLGSVGGRDYTIEGNTIEAVTVGVSFAPPG